MAKMEYERFSDWRQAMDPGDPLEEEIEGVDEAQSGLGSPYRDFTAYDLLLAYRQGVRDAGG